MQMSEKDMYCALCAAESALISCSEKPKLEAQGMHDYSKNDLPVQFRPQLWPSSCDSLCGMATLFPAGLQLPCSLIGLMGTDAACRKEEDDIRDVASQ